MRSERASNLYSGKLQGEGDEVRLESKLSEGRAPGLKGIIIDEKEI
jgi:hypothetical protein